MSPTLEESLAAGGKAARAIPAAAVPTEFLEVAGHGFDLHARWLDEPLLPEEAGKRLERRDVWAFAERARSGACSWTDVLVASYAWGYAHTSLGPTRLHWITDHPANVGRIEVTLARAAQVLDSAGPLQAFRLFHRSPDVDGVGKLSRLGPAFFAKFVYFAKPAEAELQPLILDLQLAEAVGRLTGDRDLMKGRNWSTSQYAFYLGFIHELASRAAVAPDAMERALFAEQLNARAAKRRRPRSALEPEA